MPLAIGCFIFPHDHQTLTPSTLTWDLAWTAAYSRLRTRKEGERERVKPAIFKAVAERYLGSGLVCLLRWGLRIWKDARST